MANRCLPEKPRLSPEEILMPTYEYHCPKCKATYDLQQSFSAEATHKCEACNKGTAKRVLHAPRVVFKGSGFYATDSKSRSAAVSAESNGADGEKVAESAPVAKESTATESGSSPEAAAAS
jgi:putative FmdB family regulatory protein